MHPNLAQAIAADRRADLRRAADAYRRARDYSAAGDTAGSADVGQPRAGGNPARPRRQRRIHLVPSQRRQAAVDGTARRNAADRSTDEMLVLPDGTTERAESADLCSAGR